MRLIYFVCAWFSFPALNIPEVILVLWFSKFHYIIQLFAEVNYYLLVNTPMQLSTCFFLFVCFCFNCDSISQVAANDGSWHHLCFSWTNSDGSYQLYKDGEVNYSDTDFQTGYTIKGNGIPIVGQEQDVDSDNNCGDQFDSSQSFQGYITNLNLWSCVLPAEAISEMYQTCRRGEGDVLKWSDFKHDIYGDTEVVVPSPCEWAICDKQPAFKVDGQYELWINITLQ